MSAVVRNFDCCKWKKFDSWLGMCKYLIAKNPAQEITIPKSRVGNPLEPSVESLSTLVSVANPEFAVDWSFSRSSVFNFLTPMQLKRANLQL